MQIQCPHCQGALEVSAPLAGQVCECPLCGGQFSLPKFQGTAAAAARAGNSSARPASPNKAANTQLRTILFATLTVVLAGGTTLGVLAWRGAHGQRPTALAIPAGGSIQSGLTWKQVTLRIPPSFPLPSEPPDFIAEDSSDLAPEPADPAARAKQRAEQERKFEEKVKKEEEERKKKKQQELEKRTHRVTLAIHIFEGDSGNLPLGSRSSAAPPVLLLLDRFNTAIQAEGWKGARWFLTPGTRALLESEMKKDPSKAEEFLANFSKTRLLAVLFAVEWKGRLLVSARLPDKSPVLGHMQFHLAKVDNEYLLGLCDELPEDEAALLHDLGTAFLKNGKSIAPLEVK